MLRAAIPKMNGLDVEESEQWAIRARVTIHDGYRAIPSPLLPALHNSLGDSWYGYPTMDSFIYKRVTRACRLNLTNYALFQIWFFNLYVLVVWPLFHTKRWDIPFEERGTDICQTSRHWPLLITRINNNNWAALTVWATIKLRLLLGRDADARSQMLNWIWWSD